MRHRYPHVLVRTATALSSEQQNFMTELAGVRIQHNGTLLVPHHALVDANQRLGYLGIAVDSAWWEVPLMESRPWEEYEKVLKESELQDWVLDGFLTSFQKEAIAATGHLSGCHLWHPTGAGKTLSAIMWCLLPREAPVIAVTRAASRLQFGREFERFTACRPYVLRPLTKKKQITLQDYLENKEGRTVIIVGWEALANNIAVLEAIASQGASVIFDESHRGKSAKRWQALPLSEPRTKMMRQPSISSNN